MVRMAGKLTGGTIQNSGNLNSQCQPGFSLIRNLRRLQTAMPSVESREQEITRTLKRCSKDTIDAALRYQSTPTDEDLTLIIRGVLSRSLPDEHVAAVEAANDDSRLVEDLGLDSFGMIEVVMAAETIFAISIANSEMKGNVTLGELRAFLKSKLSGSPSTEALPS